MSFAQGGVSFTPAQYRQNSRIPLDTPTPASTSGHNSAYMSSLKPARPSSNLSYDLSSGAQNIAPSRGGARTGIAGKLPIKLSQQQQQTFYRAPLGPSGKYNNDLNTEDLNLENLDIPADDTERDRRIMEEDLKREFSALRRDDNESDRDSAGFGDLSDLENGDGMGGMRNLRREMEDESLESSSNSSDLGDDFSLHIGMTGVRGGKNEVRPSAPIRKSSYESDRDISYVSVDSPRRPVPQHHHQQTQQQQQHASSIPLPPSRESSAPPASQQPTRRTAELVDHFSSRPTQFQQSKPSPTFPSRTLPKVPQNTKESEYVRSHLDYSSDRVRLPDVTGLTEGLQSPSKIRGHHPSPRRNQAGPNVGGAGLYEALDTLRARLASSEREKSTAGNKVRDLESRLYEQSIRPTNTGTRQSESEGLESQLRSEKEKAAALRAEVSRLRNQVASLTQTTESHNASIAALQSQHKNRVHNESALRSEVHAIRSGLELLGNEVATVKGDINGLVRERAVSREWENEEKERQEGMRKAAGRKEERPRSRAEQVRDEDPDRTPRASNRTYRFDAPTSPKTGTSFIPREEFAGYQSELEAQARASPTPRPKRTTVTYADDHNSCTRPHLDSVPPRPYTAPLPRAPAQAQPARNQSSQNAHTNQQQQAPPRHSRDPLHSRTNLNTEAEELQERFNRAEKIFDGGLCTLCRTRKSEGAERTAGGSAPAKMQNQWRENGADDESVDTRAHETAARNHAARGRAEKELLTVLRNKEADFEQQKRLYLELTREYEAMDAKVNGVKRQILADHLKSSIDDLELKADMVRGLHELLHRSSSNH